MLVIHWEGDLRVPISQGEELYTGLRLLGKKAELVRYPGGFHIQRTPAQAVDYVQADAGLGLRARRSPEKAGARLTRALDSTRP